MAAPPPQDSVAAGLSTDLLDAPAMLLYASGTLRERTSAQVRSHTQVKNSTGNLASSQDLLH